MPVYFENTVMNDCVTTISPMRCWLYPQIQSFFLRIAYMGCKVFVDLIPNRVACSVCKIYAINALEH